MGRARKPARDNAYKLWVESDGKAKIKDIAATLGVPDNQVRKWKSLDKWEEKIKEHQKKERSQKTTRKRGAQPGNHNASGGPVGNQFAVKHGGYAKLLDETVFSNDELAYFDSNDDIDAELELMELIRTYRIRERRLLKAINKYEKEMTPVLTGQNRFESKRSFPDKEEEELFEAKRKERIIKGERLPGDSYDIQIFTEPQYKRIERLETELTKVQRAKKEAILALHQIRADKVGSQKNAIADDFLASFEEE